MNISSEKIQVICSDGNHQLGGKDWDEAVMRYLAGEFVAQTGFDGDYDEYAQQDLRLKAEKAKQQLTSREEVPVMLDAAGLRARISLSRATFDEITSALLNETIEKTDAAIAVAEAKGYKVDEILLVGGSTRMPQVTKALVEKYGKQPKILEPDEAVAKGAAIHAVNVYIEKRNSLSEWNDGDIGENGEPLPNPFSNPEIYTEPISVDETMMSITGSTPTVVVATTKSFALKVLLKGKEEKCCNMIIKNEAMPSGAISISKRFGTAVDNQGSAELIVYESDFMEEYFEVDEDYVLGTATLELPGNLTAGSPLEVTFTLNTEGILEVTGKELSSNREVHATMQSKGIMAVEKVEELKERSQKITVM